MARGGVEHGSLGALVERALVGPVRFLLETLHSFGWIGLLEGSVCS